MISFNSQRLRSDKIVPKSSKADREKIDDAIPALLVNQASTFTITEEPKITCPNSLFLRTNNNNQNTVKT